MSKNSREREDELLPPPERLYLLFGSDNQIYSIDTLYTRIHYYRDIIQDKYPKMHFAIVRTEDPDRIEKLW